MWVRCYELVLFPRLIYHQFLGSHQVSLYSGAISSAPVGIFTTEKKWPSRKTHGVSLFTRTMNLGTKGKFLCITPFVPCTFSCWIQSYGSFPYWTEKQMDDRHSDLISSRFRLSSLILYSYKTVTPRNMSQLFNFLVTTGLFVSLNLNNS